MEKRAYLAGSIANCQDFECKLWREYAKLKLKCPTENPMERDMRGVGNFDPYALVRGDKECIDRSTHVLVHWTRIGVGTSMEIIYAYERNKKVVFVDATGNNLKGLSPWIRAHAHNLFSSLDVAIEFINYDETSVLIQPSG